MTLQTIDTYTSRAQVIRLFSDQAVKDRLDDVCELQSVKIAGTPTSGTYTLTYDGSTTASIAYNASQVTVQQALRELAGIGRTEVLTTGVTPNFTHRVLFIDVLGDASALTATDSTSGGTHSITIATLRTGDATPLDDAILRACEEINKYTHDYYSMAQLGRSNLVNQWATYLAAYYLSMRRGNPALFITEKEDAIAELKEIRSGDLRLPGIPMRRSLAPIWSSLRADPRYTWNVLRVERGSSTRTPATTLRQNIDYGEAYMPEI